MAQPDVSFYPTAQVKPIDPLALVQNYAGASKSLAENKLLQQELSGRKAIGEIVKRNTNENGILDPHKFLREVSQDPDASRMYLEKQKEYNSANPLTEFMGQNAQGQPTRTMRPLGQVPNIYGDDNALMSQPSQQRQPAQQQTNPLTGQPTEPQASESPTPDYPQQPAQQGPQLDQDKIDKLHAHNKGMLDIFGPLADNPNTTHKEAIKGIADAVAHPDIDFNAHHGAAALSDHLEYGPNGEPPEPGAVQAKLKDAVAQQRSHEAALQQHYPHSSTLANPLEIQGGGVATAVPEGYTSPLVQSRQSYDQVADEAKTVPQRTYAYNEIINLANSGALSGTGIAKLYQWAAKNLPGAASIEGISDPAVKTQELGKFMAQALMGMGVPGTDAILQQWQHGEVNPEQLIGTIKGLAPTLKAVAEGAAAKQKFYNQVTQNGSDLSIEPEAAQIWNENFDPRWIEFDHLKGKTAKGNFLDAHPDMQEPQNVQKYEALQQMGVIKGHK